MLDFAQFRVLTFDCFGTLINWETGILDTLRTWLLRHGVTRTDNQILEMYAGFEARAESGAYMPYAQVLREVVRGFRERFNIAPNYEETDCLLRTLPEWRPFPDTVPALRWLKERYALGIISNTDEDLFSHAARQLEIKFDWVITSQQAHSYKPAVRSFEMALELIGKPREQVLHVAQSLYHDIVPAKRLGLATAWVNRRPGMEGHGATLPAVVEPDLEVRDMAALVELMQNGR